MALGEHPEFNIWEKALQLRSQLHGLKATIRVMGPDQQRDGIIGYEDILHKYSGEGLNFKRQIDPNETASIYLTPAEQLEGLNWQ